MLKSKPVLLLEDDDVDEMVVQRFLEQLKIVNQTVRMTNGEQALQYPRTRGNEEPCIIAMDLNMPKMNGIGEVFVAQTCICGLCRRTADRTEEGQVYP
jgi:CheY-like chemotaxis protein